MPSSLVARWTAAIAAAVIFTTACSDSPSEPRSGPPTDIEVLSGEDQSGSAGAQLPVPIIVLVLDATGGAVPNAPMTFQVMAGGGSVQDASARTDALGLAQVRWTLGTAMHVEQRLSARAGSGNGPSVEILATAGPAAPARLEVVPPTPGANTYPGARVLDQYGNAVPGVTVTFDVIAGGGSVEGATATSNALGMAFVGRWNLGAPGANTLRASSGTLAPVTYTIMQRDMTPGRVILSSGQGQTAEVGSNVPNPLAVIVQNNAGDVLSDVVVTFTPGPNSGNVSRTTVTTGANGMATLVGWTLGPVVGQQTLVASASPTASFTFTAQATPARVGRLEKHAGDAQVADVGATVPIPPAVKVLDVYGNAVPGVSVTFSVYNGLGSITGANAVSDANGIATVGSWTLGPFAGTQTLRASAPTTSASDVDFTASATSGAAAAITPHPDNPTRALLRTEITLRVIVVDDIGRPKAGIPVSFESVRSHYGQGLTCSQMSTITNAQGIASVCYIMADNVYAYSGVYASSPGLPTVSLTVVGFTGPPSELRVTLASPTVTAGGDLGRPVFSVVDAYGNAIVNYPVTFTVTAGGGTVDGVVEASGYTAPPPGKTATGPLWRSGPVAGVNTIVISAPNVPSVTISRTTVPPP